MNESCPYCREDISSEQKKICGVCKTPHHFDCWNENGGCTVFGCTEGPKEESKISVSVEELNNAEDKRYFLYSNSTQSGPFSKSEISQMLKNRTVSTTTLVWGPEMTEWASLEQLSYKFQTQTFNTSQILQTGELKSVDQLIEIFVKDNYYYYNQKWMNPQKIGYNYAGFWLNVWWLAYRKMYGCWAIATLGYMLVGWIPFIGITISYFIGKQANTWYLDHCKKKVKEICPDGLLNEHRKEELQKKGGGSWISAIGLNIITFLISIFLYSVINSK